MAYTAKEKKERNSPTEAAKYDGPDYPYGLTLRLEDEHLKKLGISSLPKVGTSMAIEATCKVTSVSSNESERGSSRRCIELQIQKLGLDNDSDDDSMESAMASAVRKG